MANIKPNKQHPLNENGERHGEWIEYYSDGKLSYRWNYVHGIRHGLCEGYDINGRLAYYGYVSRGKEIGYWYIFPKKQYFLWII